MKKILPFLLAFLIFMPLTASAAIPGFGQLVPEVCKSCPCGFGGVMAIVQNVINLLIALAVVFMTIIIAWAGGLYILSPANPESRGTANKMLINAFIGLLIVLSAWLIVDFVMKTLYNNGSKFGPWNTILLSGYAETCLVKKDTEALFSGSIVTVPGGDPGTGGGGGGGSCTPIPDAQLATFNSAATNGGTERALADTVQRFMNMREAALRDGIDLKVTDGYRSPEEQLAAWNANGCQLISGRAVCRVRTAAIPCSLGGGGSNHTSGTALDIRLTPGAYDWLKQHGGGYGFYNNLPNDKPHWSPSGR